MSWRLLELSGPWSTSVPYLYGHKRTVITDHQALKSLPNTPQLWSKLAHGRMAIQEFDLNIEYRSGRKNEKADALSRNPVRSVAAGSEPCAVVAAVSSEPNTSRDLPLQERQWTDSELEPIMRYLEKGEFPDDDQQARLLVLSEHIYTNSVERASNGYGCQGRFDGLSNIFSGTHHAAPTPFNNISPHPGPPIMFSKLSMWFGTPEVSTIATRMDCS